MATLCAIVLTKSGYLSYKEGMGKKYMRTFQAVNPVRKGGALNPTLDKE